MWRVLHISDTHAGANAHGDPLERLETVLGAVAADGFSPDLVVHTGDISDAGQASDVEAVLDRLAGVAPVLAVPGNHDDPAPGTLPEAGLGQWRVLGIDPTLPGEITGQVHALPHLAGELTGPTVLAMHHPMRTTSTNPWFTTLGRDRAVAALSEARGPVVALSGHTHESYAESLGNVRFWGGPACYYALTHDGDTWTHAGDTGVRLVELGPDRTATSRVLRA